MNVLRWFFPRNPWHYHIRYASGDTFHEFVDLFITDDYQKADFKYEETIRSIKNRTGIGTEFHGKFIARFPDRTTIMFDTCDLDCLTKDKPKHA